MRSHTGAICTMGRGSLISLLTKQIVNSRSSTGAELIAVDDVLSKIVWLKNFLEHQTGKKFTTIIYQDNMSTIKLEVIGKESSGKQIRHFNIKYFYGTDLIKNGQIKIE
jgi:hypothetical protein